MAADNTDPFALPEDPELADLFVAWARRIALATRTMSVGTLLTFNPQTQTATVNVDILEVARASGTVPTATPRPPLLIPNVPVWMHGDGLGENYLSMPLVPTSTGMLLVSDRSLGTWLERTAPVPVDPVEWFTHRFASAVFVPGLSDNAHRLPLLSMGGPVLHGPLIYLGQDAVMSAALFEPLVNAVDALLAAGAAAVGSPGDPSGENAGAAFAAAIAAWEPLKQLIKSARVRCL